MKEYQKPFKMSTYEKNRYESMVKECNGDEKEAFDYWLRWKIKTDLFFFGNEVLGWRHACSKNRRRWRVDPVLHRWLANALMSLEDILIIISRLHLKTTWVKLRIVQMVLNNPNIRIGLFSTTTKLVRRELADIKRIFATPIILRLFAEQVPAPGKDYKNWEKSTLDELTIKRDHSLGKMPQECQITVAGADTKITGFHFDAAFFDDIIDKDTVKTVEQMEKAEEFWEYMQPILETDAVVTMTGTPYHYRDLYAKIVREKQFKNVFWRGNIENGKPIYKSWFNLKDFERLKQRMGRQNYFAQIECNCTPDEDKIFPSPQPTFKMPLPDDEKGYRYYLLIDPAATIKDYSDYTAFVIIAVNHLNQVYVPESFSIKRGGDEIADLLIKKHLQYGGFKSVGIELGLQTHLEVIIKMKIAEWEFKNNAKLKLSITPIPIKRQSKRQRIDGSLGSLVRTGKVRINSECSRLIRQMDMFTGKEGDEDDEVDALSMCVYVVESFAQHKNLDKLFRLPGLSWRDFHGKKKGSGWDKNFKKTA